MSQSLTEPSEAQPSDADAIRSLLAVAAAADGVAPMSETFRMRLGDPGSYLVRAPGGEPAGAPTGDATPRRATTWWERYVDARKELAATLQMPAGTQPEVSTDLATGLEQPLLALAPLLSALPAQPRLRALAAQEDGARARLGLERSSRMPDVTLGLSVGREGASDARERLTTLSLSVPLPLFKRNAGGIGEASAALTQVQIERESGLRDGEANLRSLHARLQSLQRRVQRLQGVVAPTLASNAQLSEKSQRAGQIGLLEHIVVSRQALDARRDLIDAQLDFQNTRLALTQAAGLPLAPEQGK